MCPFHLDWIRFHFSIKGLFSLYFWLNFVLKGMKQSDIKMYNSEQFFDTFSDNIFCLFVPNSKDWWTDNIMQIGLEHQKSSLTKSVLGHKNKTVLVMTFLTSVIKNSKWPTKSWITWSFRLHKNCGFSLSVFCSKM